MNIKKIAIGAARILVGSGMFFGGFVSAAIGLFVVTGKVVIKK